MLVVRADLRARRRRYRVLAWTLVPLSGVLAAAFGAQLGLLASSSGETMTGVAVGAGSGVWCFLIGVSAYQSPGLRMLRAAAAASRVMTVDGHGMWFAVTAPAGGEVYLPWDAVGDVTVRRVRSSPVMMVRVRAGVLPGHPGAYGLGNQRLWKALNGNGMWVGLRDVEPGADEVLAAVGRFRGQPVSVA